MKRTIIVLSGIIIFALGLKTFPRFSMNNCLFDPDYNHDGVLDAKDIKIAKKERQIYEGKK